MKNKISLLSLAVFMTGMTFTGCASKDVQVAQLEKELRLKSETIEAQEKSVEAKESEIENLKEKLSTAQESATQATANLSQSESSTNSSVIDNSSLTPPHAKAGECYAKVLIPAEYATKTEEKLLTSKVEKLTVTEPVYKEVEYKILDKAESFKYVLKPATYKCVKNKVMVEPEKVTYKVIPATFKEVEEKIMISPSREVWKKGKGPITKIDNNTGDIMCLITIPAKYKTVKTKVVDQEAKTEKIVTPAVYKYVKAKEVDQEASYEKVIIPATYKIVVVQELVKEADINKAVKEETYQTVESTYLTRAEELKWERILCETNTNKDVIRELQQALQDRGYNPGSVDGVYGYNTQKALNAFQLENNLPTGAITLESLDALNIK